MEEDLSDEDADSTGPVKWVVPAWEVLAAGRGGWRAGVEGTESEREWMWGALAEQGEAGSGLGRRPLPCQRGSGAIAPVWVS